MRGPRTMHWTRCAPRRRVAENPHRERFDAYQARCLVSAAGRRRGVRARLPRPTHAAHAQSDRAGSAPTNVSRAYAKRRSVLPHGRGRLRRPRRRRSFCPLGRRPSRTAIRESRIDRRRNAYTHLRRRLTAQPRSSASATRLAITPMWKYSGSKYSSTLCLPLSTHVPSKLMLTCSARPS